MKKLIAIGVPVLLASGLAVGIAVNGAGARDVGGGEAARQAAALTRFEAAECRFETPEGYDVRCGWLVVPEHHDAPSAQRTLRLHVGVFHRAGVGPAADPIVYLDGGPGGKALEGAASSFDARFAALAAERDVVILDQRGTGYSEPSLDCPELREVLVDQLDERLDPADAVAGQVHAARRCRDRLVGEGVDLSAYNSVQSAADVAALRRLLGYETWNVLGASYGTRLAQTLLRTHPEGVRSVVLDSAYSVSADLDAASADHAAAALDHFFAACAADPPCSRRHPELERRFEQLSARLDTEPALVPTALGDALVDGSTLWDLLIMSLYEPDLFRAVPRMVEELEQGHTAGLAELANMAVTFLDGISWGMHMSVWCHEEVPFVDRAAAEAGLARHPQLAGRLRAQLTRVFETCELWGAGRAEPVENQPVRSDVPTLVLGGAFDPVTPEAGGRQVAAELGRARYVGYAHLGHGVATAPGCPAQVTASFLTDPLGFLADPASAACAAEQPVPSLLAPTPAEVALEPFDVDVNGVRLQGMRPAGWQGPVPAPRSTVFLRAHDLLDPAVLIVGAVPVGAGPSVLDELGFDQGPDPEGSLTVDGVTWARYRGSERGADADVAIGTVGGADLVVVLTSPPTERAAAAAELLPEVLASLQAGTAA